MAENLGNFLNTMKSGEFPKDLGFQNFLKKDKDDINFTVLWISQ